MKINKAYVGKWRITEMEQWDKDYVDMVVPGHLTIGDDRVDSLQFDAVDAEVDCRVESMGGVERLEFCFEGEDEAEDVLSNPGEDRPGKESSRIAIGQMAGGRYLRIIYVPDPDPDSVFVITGYELKGKPLAAYRRRYRRRKGR